MLLADNFCSSVLPYVGFGFIGYIWEIMNPQKCLHCYFAFRAKSALIPSPGRTWNLKTEAGPEAGPEGQASKHRLDTDLYTVSGKLFWSLFPFPVYSRGREEISVLQFSMINQGRHPTKFLSGTLVLSTNLSLQSSSAVKER